MRFELRCFTILCAFAAAACAQRSSSAALPPMGTTATALSRDAVAFPDVTFQTLYPFGKNPYDGNSPTFLTPFNGVLYGVTANGGVKGDGIVFSVTTGGKEKILHTFIGTDGGGPVGPLFNVSGVFYGTASTGGGPGGVAFTIDANGNFNVVHAFQGGSNDGIQPYGGLVGLGGLLYGTTAAGGANGLGTVYSMTTGGVVHVIHSFGSGTDGQEPLSTLIVAHGELYGTTLAGGKFAGGTIFRITTAGNLKIVHNFGKGKDGADPFYGALLAVNDTLYGTTLDGGAKGVGTVFESGLTGTEKVLYSFPGTPAKGCQPYAGLVEFNGTIYGTTVGGPLAPCAGKGTLFSLAGSAGVTTLHKFSGGKDGSAPYGLASMGATLYGAATGGGLFNQGVIYSLTP